MNGKIRLRFNTIWNGSHSFGVYAGFVMSVFLCTGVFSDLPAQKKLLPYKIDAGKSKISWFGAKKIGDKHEGFIAVKSGFLKGVKGIGKNFEGNIIIDMEEIVCTDIKSPKYNKKLIAHLKSEDFFHVSKHKTASLNITKAVPQKDSSYLIHGKLTIRGKTHPVQFPAMVKLSSKGFEANGSFKFDRTKYGVKYNSGKFFKKLGDKLIKDEILLSFKIFGKR